MVVLETFITEQDLQPLVNEGCRIEANLSINRVRGNLHITGHAHSDLVDIWMKLNKKMDLSHVIHNFVFGNIKQISNIDDNEAFMPLNSFTSVTQPSYVKSLNDKINKHEYVGEQHSGHSHSIDKMKISYEYYLKIVSTVHKQFSGNIDKGYQFTVSSNIVENIYQTPTIYFRYDISAMTVEIIESREDFSHFIVQICAIIGGVYVIFSLFHVCIDTVVNINKKII